MQVFESSKIQLLNILNIYGPVQLIYFDDFGGVPWNTGPQKRVVLVNFHQLFTEITFDIIWYSQLIGDEVSSFSRSKENLINFRQIDSLLTLWINHLATFTVDIVSECFKLKENVGINLQSKHWKSVNILSTWDLRRLYFYISHVHF